MLFGAGKGKRQPGALPISQTPAAALPACLHPSLVPLLEALPQRDPTAWGGTPQPSLLSHRRARCQDVLEADPLSQCQDTAEGERQLRGQPAGKPGPHLGLSAPCSLPPVIQPPLRVLTPSPAGTAVLEKVVFGVEKNSTFLECLARSPQVTVRWLVRRGAETAPSEVRGQGAGTAAGVALSPGTNPGALLCPRSGTTGISWCWSKGC